MILLLAKIASGTTICEFESTPLEQLSASTVWPICTSLEVIHLQPDFYEQCAFSSSETDALPATLPELFHSQSDDDQQLDWQATPVFRQQKLCITLYARTAFSNMPKDGQGPFVVRFQCRDTQCHILMLLLSDGNLKSAIL